MSRQRLDDPIVRYRHRLTSRFFTTLVAFYACFVLLHGNAIAAPQVIFGAAPRQQMVSETDLERWVFQQHRTAAGARKYMVSAITLRINEINRICHLTDAQRQKLQLAGRGDISRFFDRYEAIKKKCLTRTMDNQGINQVFQDIAPLTASLRAGLFDETSFFQKSMRRTLSDEEWEAYRIIHQDRNNLQFHANIEMTIRMLEQQMPLREEQRRKLILLLLREVKPPVKSSPYDYLVIMYQISQIAEEKVKPILDDIQWQVINAQLQQTKNMKPTLEKLGLLPEESNNAGD